MEFDKGKRGPKLRRSTHQTAKDNSSTGTAMNQPQAPAIADRRRLLTSAVCAPQSASAESGTVQPGNSAGNRASCRFVLCFVFCQSSALCLAENIAVPPAGTDGPTATTDPFNFHPVASATSSRYQQVYRNSAFTSIGEEGRWITGLHWGADLVFGRGDWGAYLPSTEISLSVTSLEPDHLSTNFAENVGFNRIVVFERGPLLLDSGGRGSAVEVKFQNPFFYNPPAGNLLLEIKNYEPTCCFGIPQLSMGPLDAYNVAGDEISRVYTYDVNAARGFTDTLGLTTYFVTAPKLAVSLQTSNVVIRYPRGLDQFTIQQSPILESDVSWQPASGPYTVIFTNGEPYVVVTLPVNPKAPARFFRLISKASSPGLAGPQPDNGSPASLNTKP